MIKLSVRTEKLLDVLLMNDEAQKEVRSTLINEFVVDKSLVQGSFPQSFFEDKERPIFSILKLSRFHLYKNDLEEFKNAIKLLNTDWRDLLMAAGFGNDTEAHNAWYEEILKS